ncbi:sugar phosphate isomerase/epimerase [Chryseolinea sp. T2]|uniref:sugar phosphate isomerase/epimerase family protein n=1 Tax=Chryseolinea sp. T2 TaxID=3129255 RepID=UPI00307715A0
MKKLQMLSVCLMLSASLYGQLPELGIVMDNTRDSMVYASGYKYIVENVVKYFSPLSVDDATFEQNLKTFAGLKTKIYALNIFMPGDMKLVGPDVNEEAILKYAKGVFARCKKANIDLIIWGSGGARRVPDGYDVRKARQQFVSIAKKVAVVAKEYGIRLALENLNSTETNFINTAADALQVVKDVNHPNFRLCVDIYHMLMENEPPQVIESTRSYLVHCDIAERDGRTAPGVHGQDFVPYLKALNKVGYHKVIVLECRWKDMEAEVKQGREELLRQLKVAYSGQ